MSCFVPQSVGPHIKKFKTGCDVAVDVSGDVHVVPVENGPERAYSLEHPDGSKTVLSNFYEIEMKIIEHGLLCHELAEEELESCSRDGMRSPWSWKWKEEIVNHERVFVQRFCDIDGNTWILSYSELGN